MARLSGEVILVTGAAGDIGSAICRAVARAGGTPIATDIEARGEIKSILDVTSEADWSRLTAEIGQSPGHLDGLVNAAGIAAVGTIQSADFAQWRRVLSVNLDGAFLGCKRAFVLMRRGGAHRQHRLGLWPRRQSDPDCLCRFERRPAVAHQGGCAAWRRPGIRNPLQQRFACLPRWTHGGCSARPEQQRREAVLEAGHSAWAARHRRRGCGLCNYLLSDDSAFVTGADFPIDGGLLAR